MSNFNLGDFAENQTVIGDFNTKSIAQTAATLSGAPVLKVMKDGDIASAVATGITLTVDAGSKTGYNKFSIVTTDAYYATGHNYSVFIDTGTIDSINHANTVVRIFSIENRSRKADVVSILGTALTETAGYLAAGFKKLFNVATPVLTAESVNQTGDSFTRVGAAGASLTALGGMSAGMKAEVNAEADTALSDYDAPTKAEMDSGFSGLNDLSAAQVNAECDTALIDFFTSAATLISGIWSAVTRTLSGIGTSGIASESNATSNALSIVNEVDANEVKIDAVKVDTAAIKLQTDKMTFTVANKIDSNIEYVNGVEVTGDGEEATPWNPI